MKTRKKCLSLLLAIAVTISCLAVPGVNAQAATKTSTYSYDAKAGVCYNTAIRTSVQSRDGNEINAYLLNKGDYVSSVSTGSSNLIGKVTYSNIKDSEYGFSSLNYEPVKDLKFESKYQMEFFAKKAGIYTVKFTVKNAKKKTVCTKKVKVYATEYSSPSTEFYYAGKQCFAYDQSCMASSKASGKFKVKVNKSYKLSGIYLGTVQSDGLILYSQKIKNNSKITLSDSTQYVEHVEINDYSYEQIIDKYERGEINDYLLPITPVKVVYYDTKLKIQIEEEYYIFKIK